MTGIKRSDASTHTKSGSLFVGPTLIRLAPLGSEQKENETRRRPEHSFAEDGVLLLFPVRARGPCASAGATRRPRGHRRGYSPGPRIRPRFPRVLTRLPEAKALVKPKATAKRTEEVVALKAIERVGERLKIRKAVLVALGRGPSVPSGLPLRLRAKLLR